jgi:hypothetical protein
MNSPLAKELFSVLGVKGIFFGRAFITITKETKETWGPLKPQIFAKILDFYASGKQIVDINPQVSGK